MRRSILVGLLALVIVPGLALGQNRVRDRHKHGVLLAGAVNVNNGTSTVEVLDELHALSGLDATELGFLDAVVAGTSAASKAVVLNATSQIDNLDVTGALKVDGDPYVQCETVTVSSAELLALNATPKEIIAAPGANKFIVVHSLYLALDYATTAYAGIAAGEDLTVAYTNGSGADALPPIETTGFLDQAADTQRITFATGTVVAGGAATAAIAPVSNAAVVLSLDTGEITTGDSPLDLRVCYAVLPDLL